MYKINDYVVYKRDVCKIKDIKENKVMRKTLKSYDFNVIFV